MEEIVYRVARRHLAIVSDPKYYKDLIEEIPGWRGNKFLVERHKDAAAGTLPTSRQIKKIHEIRKELTKPPPPPHPEVRIRLDPKKTHVSELVENDYAPIVNNLKGHATVVVFDPHGLLPHDDAIKAIRAGLVGHLNGLAEVHATVFQDAAKHKAYANAAKAAEGIHAHAVWDDPLTTVTVTPPLERILKQYGL